MRAEKIRTSASTVASVRSLELIPDGMNDIMFINDLKKFLEDEGTSARIIPTNRNTARIVFRK